MNKAIPISLIAAALIMCGCATVVVNLGSGTVNHFPVNKFQRGNSTFAMEAGQANPTASNSVTVPLGGLLP